MVVFVCNECGGSFKRKQAEVHTTRCKKWSFSCMDCNKDFPGDTYIAHNQCISESKKYHGDSHVEKTAPDKNAVWMTRIRANLLTATKQKGMTPIIGRHLKKIAASPSIPRKKPKFVNYMKTSYNMTHKDTIEQLWSMVEKAGKAPLPTEKNGVTAPVMARSKSPVKKPVVQKKDGDQVEIEDTQKMESATEITAEPFPNEKMSKKRKSQSGENSEENGNVAEGDYKFTSNKIKYLNEDTNGHTVDVKIETENKSKKKNKKRKLQDSATDEPDIVDRINMNMDMNNRGFDFAELGDINIETVVATNRFKWRRTMKTLLREGPIDGIKISKLLKKIEALHNDPVNGSSEPLPRETLQTILMKNLNRKPFHIVAGKAKVTGH